MIRAGRSPESWSASTFLISRDVHLAQLPLHLASFFWFSASIIQRNRKSAPPQAFEGLLRLGTLFGIVVFKVGAGVSDEIEPGGPLLLESLSPTKASVFTREDALLALPHRLVLAAQIQLAWLEIVLDEEIAGDAGEPAVDSGREQAGGDIDLAEVDR